MIKREGTGIHEGREEGRSGGCVELWFDLDPARSEGNGLTGKEEWRGGTEVRRAAVKTVAFSPRIRLNRSSLSCPHVVEAHAFVRWQTTAGSWPSSFSLSLAEIRDAQRRVRLTDRLNLKSNPCC